MNRNVRRLVAGVSLCLLSSCLAGSKMLSMTSASVAGALKAFCEQQNVRSADTRAADSLYALGTAKLQGGQKSDGFAKMDLALIYYRLALSKQELASSEQKLADSQERLGEEQQQLNEYREVLKEMKGGAK